MVKVEVLTGNGCWRWLGGMNGFGYGQFNAAGRSVRAHRWAYEYFRSPIPEGLVAFHRCGHRWCVNPMHVEIGSRR